MTMRALIAVVGLFVLSVAVADAQVVGWRGDGSGCYPDAAPPTRWEATTPLDGVMSRAARPKDDQPAGRPLADGVIRSWLVLGPVDAPKDAVGETEVLKGEAEFAPDAGDKVGEAAWKETASDEALLNLAALFGQKTDAAAYAHAYVYAPADANLVADLVLGGRSVVWVNGKAVFKPADKDTQYAPKRVALPLRKGWNRLLIRTMPSTMYKVYSAFVHCSLRGEAKAEPAAKNVLWTSPLGGAAAPIIVGDRMFLQSEPYDLVCLDKHTGKVLWVRSNNYFEATPEADRAGKPEFDEAGKLAAELNKLNDAWASPAGLAKDQILAKDALQKKLYDAMKKIDETKYAFTKEQDLGMAGFVPVSDGKNVWAWYVSGIAARYDLDGNRKWIALDNRGAQHHGFATSPLLLDGKLIVYMGDIRCLDAQTGKQLWVKTICKEPKDHWSSAFTGSLCPLNIGGVPMFMTPNGDINRASDGEKVFGERTMSGGIQRPSPIASGDTVFKLDSGGTLHILKLPKEAGDRIQALSHVKVKLDASAFRMFFGDCWQASPLYHDGLVYCLHNSGLLSVVDAEKGEVVYRKLLDTDEFDGWGLIRPSLAMAGKYLYALSGTGTCVVFEPGREFKPVAKNRVAAVVGPGQYWQRFERFAASPMFDGKRMYLRGEANLYCIEEKKP
jgi:outer membrane protein assembly factor BamB